MFMSIFGAILSPITSMLDGWQERKGAKLKHELAVAEASTAAKIKHLETSLEADIAWENTSIRNAGWKDEWFTILLSIPMILVFVPGMAPFVKEGFDALQASTPEWYQWAFLVAVSSSFGYKKLADLMSLRKGS